VVLLGTNGAGLGLVAGATVGGSGNSDDTSGDDEAATPEEAAAPAPATAFRPPMTTRFRRRGHPVTAFMSGLLLGAGVSVLLQQYGKWPFDIVTVIVFPVAVAILSTIRAFVGRPFTMKA